MKQDQSLQNMEMVWASHYRLILIVISQEDMTLRKSRLGLIIRVSLGHLILRKAYEVGVLCGILVIWMLAIHFSVTESFGVMHAHPPD